MSMAPELGLRVSPALLNLAHLLTLPSLDLQQYVQEELAANPALEEIETYEASCARCGSPIIEGLCINCASADAIVDLPPRQNTEEIDPLLYVSSPRSLSEALLEDLYASLPTEDHPIALALVGNLDERGFLAEHPDDIAASLQVPIARVNAVLQKLRELGPPGIATLDTQECLIAQLEALAARGIACGPCQEIITNFLEDLGAGRLKKIARELHVSVREVEEARAFMRQHLWPYPVQSTLSLTSALQRTRYRVPDIAIVKRDGKYDVEVLHSARRVLRLNPLYQDLSRQAERLSEPERDHVREYIARARLFLTNLRQRESTLQSIGDVIVDRQKGFLDNGIRYLQPLTRVEIAADLGLHESTVSRAISDKTSLLPDGNLWPLSEFFVVARGVQDVLRELIDKEPRPLSDEELARQLADKGYPIARRTVAKYRDLMRIPPSHLR
jgi:RNA polymerase sigma-54 factor